MNLRSWARSSRARSLVSAVPRNNHFQHGRRIFAAGLRTQHPSSSTPERRLIRFHYNDDRTAAAQVVNDKATDSASINPPLSIPDGIDDELSRYLDRLQRGERLFGEVFIEQAWRDIRTKPGDLPVDGPVVDQIWRIFAGRKALQEEVFQYAQDIRYRRGEVYDSLYEVIMATSIKDGDMDSVLDWHKRFLKDYWVPRSCLAIVGVELLKRKDFARLFRALHEATDSRYHYAYDAVIGRALDMLLIPHAIRRTMWNAGMSPIVKLHDFLVARGDKPSQTFIMKNSARFPLCHPDNDRRPTDSRTQPSSLTRYLRDRAYAGIAEATKSNAPTPGPRLGVSSIGADSPRSLLDLSHSQGLSDDFTARMFAAGTFSADTVIKGLSIFGSPIIGSEALRQICLQVSANVEVLVEKMSLMKDFDVVIVENAYTRLIRYLCETNQGDLLELLITHDDYAMIFQDEMSLLLHGRDHVDSMHSKQWHLLQTARDFLYPQSVGLLRDGNKLLRTYARRKDTMGMLTIITRLQAQGEQVDDQTLNVIWNSFAVTRKVGKRAVVSQRVPATGSPAMHNWQYIIANVWLAIARTGTVLDPIRWRKILIDLGTGNDFHRFGLLCRQIAQSYSLVQPHNGEEGESLPCHGTVEGPADGIDRRMNVSSQLQSQTLATLFNPEMQRAIIHWGFRTGVRRFYQIKSELPVDKLDHSAHNITLHGLINDCLQGLHLIQDLEALNVKPLEHTVARAIRYRIWMLVSPGSSSEAFNRSVRAAFETLSAGDGVTVVENILRTAERMWTGQRNLFPILWEAPSSAESQSHSSHADDAGTGFMPNSRAEHATFTAKSEAADDIDSAWYARSTAPFCDNQAMDISNQEMIHEYPGKPKYSLDTLPKLSSLADDVRLARAKHIMLTLFGTNPKLGGVSNTQDRNAYLQTRRLRTSEFAQWLDVWAKQSIAKQTGALELEGRQILRQKDRTKKHSLQCMARTKPQELASSQDHDERRPAIHQQPAWSAPG